MASSDSNLDFLSTPQPIHSNFHCRVGEPPQRSIPTNIPVQQREFALREQKPVTHRTGHEDKSEKLERYKREADEAKIEKPVSVHGYPHPGEQSPKAATVMASNYFVKDSTWACFKNFDVFDYIVVGSGCTALAFIEEALSLDPMKRILCLERGDFWLPSHFQNLPLPFKMVLGGDSETFPFTLSEKTVAEKQLGYCHGSCPFFGGRSTFWSAWCPQPTPALMRDFPESMIATTEKDGFWQKAHEILNVTPATEIEDTVFGVLQKMVSKKLKQSKINQLVKSADISEPARLAVGHKHDSTTTLKFNKFSTPGPLLARYETQRQEAEKGKAVPLEIKLNCTVQTMDCYDDGYVRKIRTADKMMEWKTNKPKVILCAGAFPNATMLLNSFPEAKKTVGKRLTGHFLTHIVARVPISVFGQLPADAGLEIAAQYVAGVHPDTGRQYHVQVTAIHSPNPDKDADDLARECPDYAAAATYDQLVGSEEYIVFVCATLGEFTEHNSGSFLRRDPRNQDPTTNVLLQYTLAEDDSKLWDLMDEATYETIAAMAGDVLQVEYWDEERNEEGIPRGWTKDKPDVVNIRIPGIVHEASVSYVGKDGSLDDLYRPHGVRNVFVTGAGILPTAGSWNPTMTICGYAQDLARRLHRGEAEADTKEC